MAYQSNIPQPTQRLKDSQGDLLANFQALQTFLEVNHVTFGSGDEGKHKWVSFPTQGSAPSFAGGEEGLYNLVYATTAQNELYIHKQTAGGTGTADIPFTASILSQSTPAQNSPGWTYLPSGILMRWETVSGTGLTTVNLSAGYANFSAIFTVLLTPVSNAGSDVNVAVRLVNILSPTQFSVFFSSRTSTGATSGSAKALIIGR